MNYIIVDLEWNQGNPSHEPENATVPFEIVEIGAVKCNENRKMIDQFSALVKPQIYHELHHITRKLIHLQMKELEAGAPFPEVCNKFLDWCGPEDYIFCTWGPLDLTELQRNMEYYDMQALTAGPMKFLDVQKLFSLAFDDKKSRKNLEYAVDFLKLEKDIPFHRAFSDAYYTAKVLEKINDPKVLEKVSFDTYVKPATKADEIHIVFDDYAKYISRTFFSKQEALEDKEVSSCRCYLCHKNIKRKIKWFSPNGKHYYAVSYCDRHGFMKGKIRLRKTREDLIYVVKTEEFITPPEAEAIKASQASIKEQKRKKAAERRKSAFSKLPGSKPEA